MTLYTCEDVCSRNFTSLQDTHMKTIRFNTQREYGPKGQRIAELEIRVGSMPAGHIPLVAAQSVTKGGAMDRLVNGFKTLFS